MEENKEEIKEEIIEEIKDKKINRIIKRASTVLLMTIQFVALIIVVFLSIAVIQGLNEEISGTTEEQLGQGCGKVFLAALFIPIDLIAALVSIIFGVSNITTSLVVYKENIKSKLFNVIISSVGILTVLVMVLLMLILI